jgi:hypothetical protein
VCRCRGAVLTRQHPPNTIHCPAYVCLQNEDFYAAMDSGACPQHDVLLTNPPYSDNHVERLLRWASKYRPHPGTGALLSSACTVVVQLRRTLFLIDPMKIAIRFLVTAGLVWSGLVWSASLF